MDSSGLELFPKQFTVWVVSWENRSWAHSLAAPLNCPLAALVLLSVFSSPPLVLLLSSSCPFLVLLFVSSSCPPLLLSCSSRLAALANPASFVLSFSCPPRIFSRHISGIPSDCACDTGIRIPAATGVFKHLLFRCSSQTAGGFRKVYLHSFPPTLEFSELTPTPTKMLTLFGVYAGVISCSSPGSLLLGFYLTKKGWPHSLAAPLNSVAGLCAQALSSLVLLCGWALCPGLVLLLCLWLGSVSSPCPPLVLCGSALVLCCVQALSSSSPLWLGLVLLLAGTLWLGSVAGLCVQALSSFVLCGWALWLGLVLLLSGSCPPLVLVLAAPLNSLAGVCGPAEEECGRTNSDANADKNSLMKQFALGVTVRSTKKSMFD